MCILLDVILADKNEEERTSLHLPALLDELQGILHAHTDTDTHTDSISDSGYGTGLKILVQK